MHTKSHHKLTALETAEPSNCNTPYVCICLDQFIGEKLGLGPMLVETFSDLGCRATLVCDGDTEALQADILLLAGNCPHFAGFPALLSRYKNSRPKTLLWQLDPLPPPDMSKQAVQTGLKLAMCDSKILPQPWINRIKTFVPGYRRLQNTARAILSSHLKKKMSHQSRQQYRNLNTDDIYSMMNQFHWFKSQFSQTWCDFVFASTTPRCRLLNSIGITARYVPVGYHRGWGERLQTARDIDVLCIGTIRKARHNILKAIQKSPAAKTIKNLVVTQNCYGRQRTGLLNRTRIVLDIMRTPWEMPVIRLLMSMACGAMVVSNWTGDPEPFNKNHLVQATDDRIPEIIAYYLEHEDEREAIADSAYKFITEELTLCNSISQMMTESNINRTATAMNKI